MTKHTPTPWRVVNAGDGVHILDADNNDVATYGDLKAARKITRAVNSHDALTAALGQCVEAIKLLLADFKHLRETYEPDAMQLHRSSVEQAIAALDTAKQATQ